MCLTLTINLYVYMLKPYNNKFGNLTIKTKHSAHDGVKDIYYFCYVIVIIFTIKLDIKC